eukprot:m.174599 g.174599  ORF g.174599 m.174599 type:complete len:314 (-) comp13855_c0_seq1:290-1231(-)
MAAAKPIVVIVNADSNLGWSVVEHIRASFDDQVKMRLMFRTRDDHDISDLDGGARDIETIYGEITKPQLLGPVFEGASAAYFAVPGVQDRVAQGKMFVDACMNHGVQHAVIDSVCAADKEVTLYQKQFSEIEKYAMKRRGRAVTLKVADKGQNKFKPVICRVPYLYQNFYASIPGIRKGMLYYPLEDGALVHVDMEDVGQAIAAILASPAQHDGKTYNLVGERQMGNMIAATINMKAQVPCTYETVPDEVAAIAFQKLGLEEWVAKGDVETLKFIREGGLDDLGEGDVEYLIERKPRRFGDFVKESIKPMVAM